MLYIFQFVTNLANFLVLCKTNLFQVIFLLYLNLLENVCFPSFWVGNANSGKIIKIWIRRQQHIRSTFQFRIQLWSRRESANSIKVTVNERVFLLLAVFSLERVVLKFCSYENRFSNIDHLGVILIDMMKSHLYVWIHSTWNAVDLSGF